MKWTVVPPGSGTHCGRCSARLEPGDIVAILLTGRLTKHRCVTCAPGPVNHDEIANERWREANDAARASTPAPAPSRHPLPASAVAGDRCDPTAAQANDRDS